MAIVRPSIVGTPSVFPAANTAATTLTIAIPTPAGAAIGEGLLVALTTSGQSASDITLPSGWARIGLPAVNDPAVRILGWFFHKLTAAPAASYTFTCPIAGRFGGVMLRVANAHATQPHKFWHAYGPRTGATVTIYRLDNTTGNNQPTEDSLYLAMANAQFIAGQANTVATPPAGMTEVLVAPFGLASGSRTPIAMWSQAVSAGNIAQKSFDWSISPGSTASNGVILRGVEGDEGGWNPPPGSAFPGHFWMDPP